MRFVFVLLLLTVAVIAGCGGDKAKPTAVAVTLQEWEISASPAEVRPGTFGFSVTNSGQRQHELLLIKSDLPPSQLPMNGNQVDEGKVNVSGRIETMAAGGSGTLELELFPGKYLLICNLVEQTGGTADPHYLNGMAQSFLILAD